MQSNLNVQRPINMPLAQSPIDPPKITRHKRETETSDEPAADTLTRNDSALAERVAEALEKPLSGTRLDVPADSTFGQWWAHLQHAMAHPPIRVWAGEQGLRDPRTLMISPDKGEISFKTAPDGLIKTFGPDDKEWSAISGPILEAAKVIAKGSGVASFHPPITLSASGAPLAPLALVKGFYGVYCLNTQFQRCRRSSSVRRGIALSSRSPSVSSAKPGSWA